MGQETMTDHPVHELIRRRWSPRAFADRPVEPEKLASLFEAARWAPSSYNEQPWNYVYATKEHPEQFQRLLDCLVEGNQRWARKAPVLAISVAKLRFDHNGQPNRHALHDVGMATENLALQGVALGLAVHQMAGFHVDQARELLGIPEGYEPVAAIAVGYPANPESLSPEVREKELAPRTRKPAAQFAFQGRWGAAAELVAQVPVAAHLDAT